MKKFQPGQKVRCEINAVIVKQSSPGNPYWYDVQLPTGEVETVNISRLNWIADEPILTQDSDGSIHIISNRLTPAGVRSLIEKLLARTDYFPEEVEEQHTRFQEEG